MTEPTAPQQINPGPPAWVQWFAPALIAALVLDLASKSWVFAQAETSLPPWMAQHWNPGVAWSLFRDHPWFVALLTAVLIPVLAVIWWRGYRLAGRWENLAFGLILGGALGNGWDRMLAQLGVYRGVRDFIVVQLDPIGIQYQWPTFNIADSAISVGFAILLIRSFAKPAPRAAPAVS